MVAMVRTALPGWSHYCPKGVQASGLHAGQAKRSPGLLDSNSRHELYHPLFRMPYLYLPNDTGIIHK